MHALESDNLPHRLVPDARALEHHEPRVKHADPDGVPPGRNRVFVPVVGVHVLQLPGTL